jgi:ABC-type phosphate transport system substrate-binding protein
MHSRIFSHRLIVVCGLILAIFVLGVSAPAEMARVSAAHPGHDEATPSSSGLSASAVVVVHPNNALDCLSIEQLHRLWRDGSAIESWNDLDPNLGDDPIALHAPALDSAAYEAFTAAVLGGDGAIRSDVTMSPGEDQTIEGVATDEHAAGVVSYASFVEMQRPLKAIAVDAGEGCVEPSPATIDDGSYVPAMSTGNADTA